MDDKKLNELLNKAHASLTEEQKEKAKACKTAKELLDYLSAEGVELPDEVLDAICGGSGDPKGKGQTIEWTCPYCEQTITLYKIEDAARHMTKCPKNPYKS